MSKYNALWEYIKNSSAQVGTCQVSVTEVCLVQNRVVQVSLSQVGLVELCLAQV